MCIYIYIYIYIPTCISCAHRAVLLCASALSGSPSFEGGPACGNSGGGQLAAMFLLSCLGVPHGP